MKKYTVEWTPDALQDFDNIIGYIYNENSGNAKEIYLSMKEQAQSLENFPFRGRVVPELKLLGYSTYRELIYKRWRIIYRIDGDMVYLLLILDSRQDMQEQLVQRVLNH